MTNMRQLVFFARRCVCVRVCVCVSPPLIIYHQVLEFEPDNATAQEIHQVLQERLHLGVCVQHNISMTVYTITSEPRLSLIRAIKCMCGYWVNTLKSRYGFTLTQLIITCIYMYIHRERPGF